jgi:hypothetical protein
MTDIEYIERLESETGIDRKNFGFIMGLSTPFDNHQGFQSANREPGYIIWRRTIKEDGTTSFRELKTPGLNFEQTKAFLTLEDQEFSDFISSLGIAVIQVPKDGVVGEYLL